MVFFGAVGCKNLFPREITVFQLSAQSLTRAPFLLVERPKGHFLCFLGARLYKLLGVWRKGVLLTCLFAHSTNIWVDKRALTATSLHCLSLSLHFSHPVSFVLVICLCVSVSLFICLYVSAPLYLGPFLTLYGIVYPTLSLSVCMYPSLWNTRISKMLGMSFLVMSSLVLSCLVLSFNVVFSHPSYQMAGLLFP